MTTETAPTPATGKQPTAPRIFSGIQPSGVAHLGNDLGAIRNYVALQDKYEAVYCIVDYHALTSTHDPDVLRARTRDMAASLLALGLDPERCTLFVQSHRPEHTELAWLLATVTPVSWLERTPTYKEKRETQPDDINHGLLTYPVLQAGDIAMYKASLVPVGKDQAAHLELSREIVRAFNNRYGETFPEMQAVFTEAPTVIGTDGARKMSKSVGNTIDILADPEVIRKQIMSMVTDTRADPSDPARPARSLQRLPAPPLLRRRLRVDLGRRANGSNRLRRHEAPARRPHHRAVRPGAGALPRAPIGARAGRRDSRCRGGSPRPDGRRNDGRSPRKDGLALAGARPMMGTSPCRR